jgi:orotidine-5'-phosphate decarboxylase
VEKRGEAMTTHSAALTARERLIVALDVNSLDEARRWIEELREEVGLFKVGLELFARYGTILFHVMREEKVPFFFDCKFLDIPNTVAGASRALVGKGIYMFNIHATGGSVMMEATMEAVEKEAKKEKVERPLVIAVTILTSLTRNMLDEEMGISRTVEASVGKLAMTAKRSGLDGVVASAKEVSSVRQLCGRDFLVITPGIRPTWAADDDDQKRVVTPAQAMKNGSDYIVVGRPITRASSMKDAARRIVYEMETEL